MFKWWNEFKVRGAYWNRPPVERARFRIIYKAPYFYLEAFRPDEYRWIHVALDSDKEKLRSKIDEVKRHEREATEYID